MSEHPKVSIVIPVYNGANYLKQAIESAIAQTYSNVEIIVVNDGSSDNGKTEAIALSYGNRIRYFAQRNGGVASALNKAIAEMDGEYFSWLSHDDEYAPEKIAFQMKRMQAFGRPAVVFCQFEIVDEDTGDRQQVVLGEEAAQQTRVFLAMGGSIHGCSLLIPRSLLERYGPFDERLRHTQDAEYWFRMAGKETFLSVPEILLYSRKHADQGSQSVPTFRREADTIISRFVDALNQEEFLAFHRQSIDSMYTYMNFLADYGLYGTAASIMSHIHQFEQSSGAVTGVPTVLNRLQVNGVICEGQNRMWNDLPLKTDKPRVILISPNWVDGGSRTLENVLLRHLSEDFQFIIVVQDLEITALKPEEKRYTYVSIQADLVQTWTEPEKQADRLGQICKLLEADIVMSGANFLPPVQMIYERLGRAGMRGLACQYGHYFLLTTIPDYGIKLGALAANLRYADAVSWLTPFGYWLHGQHQPNSVWLPAANTFPARPSIVSDNGKHLLAIGRFDDRIKRLDRILEMFAIVVNEHPTAVLTVVGKVDMGLVCDYGTGRSIKQLLKKLAIPKQQLRFVGEQQEVASYYERASVLVFTSELEGMPMVINEACSYGLPVVMQRIEGLEMMVADGDNGFVVSQDDQQAMAQACSKLLHDPQLRRSMGQAAMRRIRYFSAETVCERWKTCLLTLSQHDPDDGAVVFPNSLQPEGEVGYLKAAAAEYERHTLGMLDRNDGQFVWEPSYVPWNEAEERDIAAFNGYLQGEIAEPPASTIRRWTHLFNKDILQRPSERIGTVQQLRQWLSEGCGRPLIMIHLTGWNRGGAERLISTLLGPLSLKYRIVLVVFEPINVQAFPVPDTVCFLGMGGVIHRQDRLLKLAQVMRPEVFIANNSCLPELNGIFAKMRDLHIHSIAYTLEYFFYAHRADALVTYAPLRSRSLGEADVAAYLNRFGANAHNLVHDNGAWMPPPASYVVKGKVERVAHTKKMLAVGRFNDPVKRLDRMLDVFGKVFALHPTASLTLVGPFNEQLRILSQQKTIGEQLADMGEAARHIHFAGEQEDPRSYYESHDLLLLTSDSEGLAMVLLEAMSYGLPAVIQDVPGLDDVVIEGSNGFIVKQDDQSTMAVRIGNLLENHDLYRRFSAQAQRTVESFAQDSIIQRWVALLEAVRRGKAVEWVADQREASLPYSPTFADTVLTEYEKFMWKLGITLGQERASNMGKAATLTASTLEEIEQPEPLPPQLPPHASIESEKQAEAFQPTAPPRIGSWQRIRAGVYARIWRVRFIKKWRYRWQRVRAHIHEQGLRPTLYKIAKRLFPRLISRYERSRSSRVHRHSLRAHYRQYGLKSTIVEIARRTSPGAVSIYEKWKYARVPRRPLRQHYREYGMRSTAVEIVRRICPRGMAYYESTEFAQRRQRRK